MQAGLVESQQCCSCTRSHGLRSRHGSQAEMHRGKMAVRQEDKSRDNRCQPVTGDTRRLFT